MNAAIVLAMHGTPPNDFPKHEMAEFFTLHAQLHQAAEEHRATIEQRYHELDVKMRAWPRTPHNDPFFAGSKKIALHLGRATGCKVIVGFNEFCNPTLDDALEQAITLVPERIIVITPTVTRGGEHAEQDIPAAIRRAQGRHPEIPIAYSWPFEAAEVAQLLAEQVRRLLQRTGIPQNGRRSREPAPSAATAHIGTA